MRYRRGMKARDMELERVVEGDYEGGDEEPGGGTDDENRVVEFIVEYFVVSVVVRKAFEHGHD